MDGQTQLVGLLGWPVGHSLSPAMHNAAFAALGLNWSYVPLPVPPGQTQAAVRGLVALGFRGANVTAPHKQAVLPWLDSITPRAQQLGAVNTLLVERVGGSTAVHGDNTDEHGFLKALHRGGFEPAQGGRAVVAGSGGAARAVVAGLLRSGMEEVVVLSRSMERGQELLAGRAPGKEQILLRPFAQKELLDSTAEATLLVNATPVGSWPHAEATFWPEGIAVPSHLTVFDLVYNPPETRLLQQAQAGGARAIGGLEMLVQQGALAFELWTGAAAPTEVMRSACRRALE